MALFCTHCGQPVDQDDQYCACCGKPIKMRSSSHFSSKEKAIDTSPRAIDPYAQLLPSSRRQAPAKTQLSCAWSYHDGQHGIFPAIAWSPDGRLLACSVGDHVQIREATTGFCQLTYADFSGGTLVWLSNGTYLVTARDSIEVGTRNNSFVRSHLLSSIDELEIGREHPRIDIWEAATGICQFRYEGHDEEECFAWSQDGSRLAAIINNSPQIWPTQIQGQEPNLPWMTLPEHDIYELLWSPAGRWLAGNTDDLKIILFWESTTGTRWWEYSCPEGRYCSEMVWSPDGRFLALSLKSGSLDYHYSDKSGRYDPAAFAQVHLLDVTAKNHVHTYIVGAVDHDLGLLWSPDSQFLFSVCDRKFHKGVSVCEVSSLIHQLILLPDIPERGDEYEGPVMAMACATDSSKLAISLNGGGIQIWDMTTRAWTAAYTEHPGKIRRLAWSPHSKLLALTSPEGGVCLLRM